VATNQFGFNARVLLGISDDSQDARTRTIAAFRFIYISIYALVAFLPFDVSVSLEKVYAQLFPADDGRIRLILDPLYHVGRWGEDGLKLTVELLGLVPVAILTAFLTGARGRMNIYSPILACVALAVCCELAQVFLMSRSTDIAMLPLAALAGVIGWGLVKVWFNLNHIETLAAAHGDESRWKPIAVALAGYGVVLLFLATSPFTFETDPVVVANKVLHDSNLFPFKEHFSTRSLGSAVDIVKEVGLFVPMGILFAFLIAEIRPRWPRNQAILVAGIACGLFAVFTELSQSVSVGRYIDVTDIFLAGAGGLAGAVMMQLFRFRGDGSHPREKQGH
jgi:glycopeptide antibiotics resistance protein